MKTWRQRYYVNGVDDCGLRVWEKGFVKTLCGGNNAPRRGAASLETPARDAFVVWCHVLAVDPRPPHDIYFKSGGTVWNGRIGKLVRKQYAEAGREAGQ